MKKTNKIVKNIVKLTKSVKVVGNLTAEQKKAKISELRISMVHSTVESIAISILALILFIGAPSVFPKIIDPFRPSSLKIMQAIVAIPTVFWVLSILGNSFSYFKIYKLQKSLSSKK